MLYINSVKKKRCSSKAESEMRDFIVDYADVEVEGTDNAEQIVIEAFKKSWLCKLL